jgi:hypothetical protein
MITLGFNQITNSTTGKQDFWGLGKT